jgi:NADH-quinone oxidoreductase subunit J
MTTRPEIKLGPHLWRGLSAMVLFGILTLVFLGADFGTPAGFAAIEAMDGTTITDVIGFAMFDIPHDSLADTGTETFLVAFIVIAFVLDAALEAAVMLARREEAGEVVSALKTWGGDD